MVIDEKALVKQMRGAYGSSGYTVIVTNEGTTVIHCGYWAVEVDTDNVPRKALSLMALHMGFLPMVGDAYKVRKGDGAPLVQKMLYDEAIAPIERLDSEHRAADIAPTRLLKTPLTYDSCNVWQSTRDLEILLIDPKYEAILLKTDAVTKVGNALFAEGEISKVYIMPVENKAKSTQLMHLAAIRWAAE